MVKHPATTNDNISEDVMEFIKAIDKFKKKNKRKFLAWSEVLEILRSLGYRKVAEPNG